MTDTRSPLRALRAALFAAVCVIAAAVGHSSMSGHEVPVPGLLAAFAVTGGLAWTAGHRRRGVFAVGGGLLAVQGVLHLVFGTAQGPGAGHHRMSVAHEQTMDASASASVSASLSASGQALAQDQGSSSLAMTAAHLAAALVCGLWLAHGEAAFFRLARTAGALAFTPLRLWLLLAVVRPPALPRRVRPQGPRTPRRHSHGVVLAHTLSRRGPPRSPAGTRATAPAPPTVRPRDQGAASRAPPPCHRSTTPRTVMAIDDPVQPPRETEALQAPAPAAPAERTTTWSALRPLVLRIHFYAGLLIAPLLLIAATSGLLYALSFQAEKYLYSHELRTPVGERSLPLGDQLAAARAAHPQGTVTAVWPSAEDGATTRVLMTTPEVEEGRSLAVFVDPYTAEVRGELASYGSSGALPLRTWLDELHRDLHLGDLGRHYSELAASWLWVVALGGLFLWLGRRRTAKRDLVVPERGAKGRRKTLSWHGTVGMWAVLGLVLLSATGLTWSRYAGENIGAVQDQLGGATPVVSAVLAEDGGHDGGGHEGHEGHEGGGGSHESAAGTDVGIDNALAAARQAGVDGQLSVILPTGGSGYVVKETDTQFPVHLDSVAVDPADGLVIDELRFADYPLLAKLTRFGIDAHTGVFLGLANQLALASLASALILLIVWGYRMWWLRRPTKERRLSAGRPTPRGAWRKAPVTALLPLAALAVLVGWSVPLLGISLLVFLAVDLLLGAVARVRARTARTAA